MQAPPKPEAIIEWLQKEMNYPSPLPSPEQIRKICRGNMIPIWSFLLGRVRSEKTVATVRRNIVIHGAKGTRRSSEEARERDEAEEEAERMRVLVRRMRRDVRSKMAELAREEADRKRNIDDRANAR